VVDSSSGEKCGDLKRYSDGVNLGSRRAWDFENVVLRCRRLELEITPDGYPPYAL